MLLKDIVTLEESFPEIVHEVQVEEPLAPQTTHPKEEAEAEAEAEADHDHPSSGQAASASSPMRTPGAAAAAVAAAEGAPDATETEAGVEAQTHPKENNKAYRKIQRINFAKCRQIANLLRDTLNNDLNLTYNGMTERADFMHRLSIALSLTPLEESWFDRKSEEILPRKKRLTQTSTQSQSQSQSQKHSFAPSRSTLTEDEDSADPLTLQRQSSASTSSNTTFSRSTTSSSNTITSTTTTTGWSDSFSDVSLLSPTTLSTRNSVSMHAAAGTYGGTDSLLNTSSLSANQHDIQH